MAGRTERDVAPPLPNDDCVIIFRTERSSVRGRLVRLGAAANTILSSHQLPPAVAAALGEALALVSLFGSALKADGKIILQTRTDGIVSFLVADLLAAQEGTSALRGYARFDKEALGAISRSGAGVDPGRMLGNGTMAVTLDEPGDAGRYQAVTALEGVTLAEAASTYFEDRDATPAFVKLAVAPLYVKSGGEPKAQWRAGGLMLQPIRPAPAA
jgi:molecular chaperone Hsp33